MSTIDQQFVEYIVKTLVNNPDKVQIDRIIGRRGATAQSIRTLLRALGTKNDARYNLKIVNNDGYEGGEKAPKEDAPKAEEAPVEEGSELAKKTRQELADLDDLDI